MRKLTVYTSGPIDFASDAQVLGWRAEVDALLRKELGKDFELEVLNPRRRSSKYYEDIVNEDMDMMDKADVIVAWTPPVDEVPRMIGTPVEIYHCGRVLKKPVFSWGCKKTSLSPWIRCFVYKHSKSLQRAVKKVVVYVKTK